MGTRLTPIERAIQGSDKRTRYRARMAEKGFRQVNVWVPADMVGQFKALAAGLTDEGPEGVKLRSLAAELVRSLGGVSSHD